MKIPGEKWASHISFRLSRSLEYKSMNNMLVLVYYTVAF